MTGTVTYKEKPVTGGSLTFSPLDDGSPASASINKDGSFKLESRSGSGVAVGKYRVIYSAPMVEVPEGLKPGQSGPKSPYEALVPKTAEVEVTSGASTIDIELVRPGS